MTLFQLLLSHLVRSYFIIVKIMFSSNYWCWYHIIIYVNITFQGMSISPPRYVRVNFHSTSNSLLSVPTNSYPHMSWYHLSTIYRFDIANVILPILLFKTIVWKLHLVLLKPLFSNLPCVYFWDVVSYHLHLLPLYHQSHLHLACLFAIHLCHLPHILP